MSYKISFNSGTGHDDIDEDQSSNEPDVIEFETEAERKAFLLGVNMTSEVMNGWVDAWVETKKIDEAPIPNPDEMIEAREFIQRLLDDPESMRINIGTWLGENGSLWALSAAARERRADPEMAPLLKQLRGTLLDSS